TAARTTPPPRPPPRIADHSHQVREGRRALGGAAEGFEPEQPCERVSLRPDFPDRLRLQARDPAGPPRELRAAEVHAMNHVKRHAHGTSFLRLLATQSPE